MSVSQQIDKDNQPTKRGDKYIQIAKNTIIKKTCNFTYQGNTNYNLVDLQTFDNLEQVLGHVGEGRRVRLGGLTWPAPAGGGDCWEPREPGPAGASRQPGLPHQRPHGEGWRSWTGLG